VEKARDYLKANDKEYQDFLLAKAAHEEDVKLRKQGEILANALKPTLDKIAAMHSPPTTTPKKEGGDGRSRKRSPISPAPSEDGSSQPPTPRVVATRSPKSSTIPPTQAKYLNAIFDFKINIGEGSAKEEAVTSLTGVLGKSETSRKNKACIDCFNRYLDSLKPRPKTPKSAKDKAELIVKLTQ